MIEYEYLYTQRLYNNDLKEPVKTIPCIIQERKTNKTKKK